MQERYNEYQQDQQQVVSSSPSSETESEKLRKSISESQAPGRGLDPETKLHSNINIGINGREELYRLIRWHQALVNNYQALLDCLPSKLSPEVSNAIWELSRDKGR